jgi:histidinol-phosphate/aromatic aminotransferase/cobyric acid decarboxylase-like protein
MAKDESTGKGATPPIKVVADPAVGRREAFLIAGPLVLQGCSPELLAFFNGTDEGLGRDPHIVVDPDAATIAFHEFAEAALGMSVATVAGVVSDQQARDLLSAACEDLARRRKVAKLTNIGGNDGQQGQQGQR